MFILLWGAIGWGRLLAPVQLPAMVRMGAWGGELLNRWSCLPAQRLWPEMAVLHPAVCIILCFDRGESLAGTIS